MKILGFRKRFMLLALGCVLEGIMALVALLIIPTDPKNSFFVWIFPGALGFNGKRFVATGDDHSFSVD